MLTRTLFLLAFAACAHSTQTVADADVGRLPAGSGAPIDAARRERADANDALSRAKLEQQSSENERQIANADVAAAKAEQTAADAVSATANASRDPAALHAARKRQAAARARISVQQRRAASTRRSAWTPRTARSRRPSNA